MKTKHANVSFQSSRVFCSRAKLRLLLLASLALTLIGSVWSGSMPFDLSSPDALMHFKGGTVARPGGTGLIGPPVHENGLRPRPAPDGTPYFDPTGSKK